MARKIKVKRKGKKARDLSILEQWIEVTVQEGVTRTATEEAASSG